MLSHLRTNVCFFLALIFFLSNAFSDWNCTHCGRHGVSEGMISCPDCKLERGSGKSAMTPSQDELLRDSSQLAHSVGALAHAVRSDPQLLVSFKTDASQQDEERADRQVQIPWYQYNSLEMGGVTGGAHTFLLSRQHAPYFEVAVHPFSSLLDAIKFFEHELKQRQQTLVVSHDETAKASKPDNVCLVWQLTLQKKIREEASQK